MKRRIIDFAGIALAVALLPCTALAFDSGSTGVDGDFNPPVNTEVVLPPNGILNYRSVNIPLGVTVRFKRNSANTPVTILVAGDAVIVGTINLDGEIAPVSGPGTANDNPLDDGLPGKGGPGGFDGGFGGLPTTSSARGGNGLGPGGGGAGGELAIWAGGIVPGQGGGAGYATSGNSPVEVTLSYTTSGGTGGEIYGSKFLVPLIGGSGGGGGGRGSSSQGEGGGGGGGALLLAATGTVTLSGVISAKGGSAGRSAGTAFGGAGSGGAIRIVATTITGRGAINVDGGTGRINTTSVLGKGGQGRVRLEAENFVGIGDFNSALTFGTPAPLFVAGQPVLHFATVAGIPVPANPTGFGDVTVPAATANPVTIALATSGIPVGSTVKVSVTPQYGAPISVDSPPTAGSLANSTTSVSLDIPPGNSVLSAQTSFTVVAAVGDALSRFAQGERVEKVTLTSTLGQGEKATLHTVAGRQFEVEPALLKLAALLQ
jgi:hypothetical protein